MTAEAVEKEVQEEEEQERFVVDDDDKACWALQKIKELEDQVEEKEKLAQRQIDQVNNWLENETSSLEKKINNFNNMLFEYAQQLREEDPDLKTHSLPFGKLQFRKRRPKWQYEDELLDTVKEKIPDAVRVKEDVDKRTLKKIIKDSGEYKILDDGRVVNTESGELVEGLKVVDRGESFKVKTV